MKINKPKFNFFKNTAYALIGLKHLIKYETSFKIELIITAFLIPVLFIMDTSLQNKLLMFAVLMGVLIAETINSAIERIVDLVTQEFTPLAGAAKDIGSSIVFLSILLAAVVWGVVLFNEFF